MTKTAKIDELAATYLEYKAREEAAAAEKEAAAAELLELIAREGAAAGQKSKRIETERYQATATYGEIAEVDVQQVYRLEQECKRVGKPRMFHKLISEDVRYRVTEGAAIFLSTMPEAVPESIERIFALVRTVKAKKPSLRVEAKRAHAIGTANP